MTDQSPDDEYIEFEFSGKWRIPKRFALALFGQAADACKEFLLDPRGGKIISKIAPAIIGEASKFAPAVVAEIFKAAKDPENFAVAVKLISAMQQAGIEMAIKGGAEYPGVKAYKAICEAFGWKTNP